MSAIFYPNRKFYLVTHFSLGLNPSVLLQYFPGTSSLPHRVQAEQKGFQEIGSIPKQKASSPSPVRLERPGDTSFGAEAPVPWNQ